jgi:hypothetical protein
MSFTSLLFAGLLLGSVSTSAADERVSVETLDPGVYKLTLVVPAGADVKVARSKLISTSLDLCKPLGVNPQERPPERLKDQWKFTWVIRCVGGPPVALGPH